MKKHTFCDLSSKEVISCCNGRRIGVVTDLEIDCDCGRILTLLVKENSRNFEFAGKSKCISVPWERIDTIGEDFIIINQDFSCECIDEKREHKKGLFSAFSE